MSNEDEKNKLDLEKENKIKMYVLIVILYIIVIVLAIFMIIGIRDKNRTVKNNLLDKKIEEQKKNIIDNLNKK